MFFWQFFCLITIPNLFLFLREVPRTFNWKLQAFILLVSKFEHKKKKNHMDNTLILANSIYSLGFQQPAAPYISTPF